MPGAGASRGKISSQQLGAEIAIQTQLIDASQDAIIACDGERRITRWNRGAEELYGWTAEEAIGQIINTFLKTEFPPLPAPIDVILEKEGTWRGELTHTRRDGTKLICESRHTLLRNGREGAFLEINRDITERKRTMERLARAYRLARLGTWEQDLASGRIDCSEETYRIFGIDRATFEPTIDNFFNLIHPDDREMVRLAWSRAVQAGRTSDIEHRIVSPDRKVRQVRQYVEFEYRDGCAVRLLGTTQDITAYKHLEEQLRQAQKLESIGLLAGGIAHDFNNFLTIVNGYAELLLETLPESEVAVRKQVSEILRAGNQAAGVARQLTVFSRRQIIRPQILNLNDLILESEKAFGSLLGEHIKISTKLSPSLGMVMADPGMMQQVLLNMVLNARDAMPKGGTLLLETTNALLDEEFARSHEGIIPGPYVCMVIGDTGIGMDEETRQRIFEPFFTTKAPGVGTGLGLSTVYGIIRQANGAIWVYSEPGKGTNFKIYLPRIEEPAKDSQSAADSSKAGQGRETILIVEDQHAVRGLASQALRRYGYTVLEAESASEALSILARHSDSIDLLITDVIMPDMLGVDLALQARTSLPGIKTVLMSGYTSEMLLRQGVLETGVHLIQKPFAPSDLAAAVRSALDQ